MPLGNEIYGYFYWLFFSNAWGNKKKVNADKTELVTLQYVTVVSGGRGGVEEMLKYKALNNNAEYSSSLWRKKYGN